MIISFIILFILSYLYHSTESRLRKELSVCVLLVYFIFSLFDYYWLTVVEDMPLHPSDPTGYYLAIRDISFSEIFELDGSNTFYFIVNWFIYKFWQSPYWLSVWIKIDNCFLAILIYLLLTHKLKKVTKFDYILLFNPYMILTINRNVRDLYIILFVLVILIGLKVVGDLRVKKRWALLCIILLLMTRAILVGPLALIYIFMRLKTISKQMCCFIIGLLSIGVYVAFPLIFRIMSNQMISSMDYIGEDVADLLPFLQNDYSVGSFLILFKRLLIATFVYLFTPNPINFYSNWVQTMSVTGLSNIYTGFDNMLIVLGGWYNYIFVIPYLIFTLFHWKSLNRPLLLFTFLYAILYIVSFVGQTDIRNHNTFIFFFLATLMHSRHSIKLGIKDYAMSLLLLIGISKTK